MSTDAGENVERPRRIETIARAVLQRDGRVLLCRDRKGGYCYLPGGHVEPGESAADAVARELLEEAGLRQVEVGACMLVTEQRFVQKGKPRHELNLVFHVERCVQADGTPLLLGAPEVGDTGDAMATSNLPVVESQEDHIEFIWVEAAALHDVDLRPRSMKAWLMGGSTGLDRPGWMSHAE